jgi:hypothetical protein
MEKEITIESIKDKSYEEMTYEERLFFCANAHLLHKDTDDDGIIIVDDIDSYKRQRGLVDISQLEEVIDEDVMSIEEAKERTIESVRKIYEENGNL